MEKVLPWQLEEVRSQLVGWGRSRCLPACPPPVLSSTTRILKQ